MSIFSGLNCLGWVIVVLRKMVEKVGSSRLFELDGL